MGQPGRTGLFLGGIGPENGRRFPDLSGAR